MSIQLSPEILACAYDYLCCQKPFSQWNMPPSEDVKFLVIRSKNKYAHYQMAGGVHHIALSSRAVGRHDILISTMAHEMIHLHAEAVGMTTSNAHDKTFHKLADRVCKIHEFDRRIF